MKYCIFILISILIIFVIFNLYNMTKIEKFHEEQGSTELQNSIKTTIDNQQTALTEYQQYINTIQNNTITYGSNLNNIDNIFRGSGGVLDQINNFQPDIILDSYNKHPGKTCLFETQQNCGSQNTSGSSTFPIKYNTEQSNTITLQECATQCAGMEECISFSYKDGESQECHLSSVCTENNADDNEENTEDYTLYTKKDEIFTQFPLMNYNPNYNKKCRYDIYKNLETNINDTNTTLGSCASYCNNSSDCVAFEYNPDSQLCSPKSTCYENGCLEDSSNNYIDNCTNTTLYSKKSFDIPDGTTKPDYLDCKDCNNDETVYNSVFLRFYENENSPTSKIYTNNVANIGSTNELDNMNYYKITKGYHIQVFKDPNFLGEFEDYMDENQNIITDKYRWVKWNYGRTAIDTLPEGFRKFMSFKIYSDTEAEIRKTCKGEFAVCQLVGTDADPKTGNMEQGWISEPGTPACFETMACDCSTAGGYWENCVGNDDDGYTQSYNTGNSSPGDNDYCPRPDVECDCSKTFDTCVSDGNGGYVKSFSYHGDTAFKTQYCPDLPTDIECNCDLNDENNWSDCNNNIRNWIGEQKCPNIPTNDDDDDLLPGQQYCDLEESIIYNDKIKLEWGNGYWVRIENDKKNTRLERKMNQGGLSKFYIRALPQDRTTKGNNELIHNNYIVLASEKRYDRGYKEDHDCGWWGCRVVYKTGDAAKLGHGGGENDGDNSDINNNKKLRIMKHSGSPGNVIRHLDHVKIKHNGSSKYLRRESGKNWLDFDGNYDEGKSFQIHKA